MEELRAGGVLVVGEVGVEPETGPGVCEVVGLLFGLHIPELSVVSPLHPPRQAGDGLQAGETPGHVLDDGQPGPAQLLQQTVGRLSKPLQWEYQIFPN